MAKRDDRLAALEAEARALVERDWKDVKAAATADAIAFLRRLEPDLDQWATQFAAGEMDEKDLEFLIKARKDRAELEELKRIGLTKAKRDRLVNSIAELAVKAVSKIA